MIDQDRPVVFMDAECPHCGAICGNGGYGDTFYCFHCGWIGKIVMNPDDIKAIQEFIQRAKKHGKEATS